MGEHIIQVSRLTRKLRAIWGLRGEDYPTDAKDLPGYLALEMDRPEWLVPGAEIPIGTSVTFGAVAAQRATLSVFNPVGSGIIAVIEYAQLIALSPALLWVEWVTADNAIAVGSLFTRDNRVGDPTLGNAVASGLIARANDFAGGALGSIFLTSAANVPLTVPVVLAPGAGLVLQSDTQNIAATITLAGRVRPQEAGKFS